ncbi:SWIM zinc finger domain-containing protein, partial [Paenibacillus sp. TAF58]
MSLLLTDGIIKSLCGRFSYEKGEAYYRERQVTFLSENPRMPFYEATVERYNDTHLVTVEDNINGDVIAHCTCPAYDPDDKYCEHIAAVLLSIHAIQHESRDDGATTRPFGNLDGDHRLTSHILDLFGNKPQRSSRSQPLFDTRLVLELEFTCKPFQYGYRKFMFGIELKVGPKRLYIVQRVREFLDHIERREAYVFSKHFTYDPKLHSFQKEDDAIIRQLIEIYRNEQLYHETSTKFSANANHMSGDR